MDKFPVYLAPLAGITDKSFRKLCFEQGCDMAFTEMVSAKGLYYKNENTKDLLAIDETEGPVTIQLFGHEPEMFSSAMPIVNASKSVGININMGCPVHKVVKTGDGSAMLLHPELAAQCVSVCVEHTKKAVSVKMRIGYENSGSVVDFAKRMEDAGASFVIVHGRTREQFYSGEADWGKIKEIKDALSIPVVGNGDIFSYEDALRMVEETGVDAVMIGRGAMGNPWIFSGAKPSLDEIKDTIIRHASMLVLDKGEYVGIRQMRTHAAYYIKGIPGAAKLRVKINGCCTLEELIELIKEI